MQRHPGETRIAVMPVRGPIARVKMHLDIPVHTAAIQFPFAVAKIRALLQIPAARMTHTQIFTRQGAEIRGAKIAAQPDFLQHALGHRVGPIQALHLRHGERRRVFDDKRSGGHTVVNNTANPRQFTLIFWGWDGHSFRQN
jgi:hypothetical protein